MADNSELNNWNLHFNHSFNSFIYSSKLQVNTHLGSFPGYTAW